MSCRLVPIQPDVEQLLRTYLASTGRRLGQPGPLFRAHDRGAPTRQLQRLGVSAVWAMVTRCARAASIDAKRVHTLRHTMALRFIRRGGNVVALKEILGHASVVTTQRYLAHLRLAELRQAMPELPVGN